MPTAKTFHLCAFALLVATARPAFAQSAEPLCRTVYKDASTPGPRGHLRLIPVRICKPVRVVDSSADLMPTKERERAPELTRVGEEFVQTPERLWDSGAISADA